MALKNGLYICPIKSKNMRIVYIREGNSEALGNTGVHMGSPRSQIIIACDLS